MPMYDYQCSACRRRFEVRQSMTARPLRKCARCGKMAARRLIGAGAGLIFKGSGFYVTDYRKPGYQAAAKAEATPSKTETSDSKTKKP